MCFNVETLITDFAKLKNLLSIFLSFFFLNLLKKILPNIIYLNTGSAGVVASTLKFNIKIILNILNDMKLDIGKFFNDFLSNK